MWLNQIPVKRARSAARAGISAATEGAVLKRSFADLFLVLVVGVALRLVVRDEAFWRIAASAFLLVWAMRLAEGSQRTDRGAKRQTNTMTEAP